MQVPTAAIVFQLINTTNRRQAGQEPVKFTCECSEDLPYLGRLAIVFHVMMIAQCRIEIPQCIGVVRLATIEQKELIAWAQNRGSATMKADNRKCRNFAGFQSVGGRAIAGGVFAVIEAKRINRERRFLYEACIAEIELAQ